VGVEAFANSGRRVAVTQKEILSTSPSCMVYHSDSRSDVIPMSLMHNAIVPSAGGVRRPNS
jgi:hypothetical protein